MEPFDHPTKQQPPQPANLQAASIYHRRFHCRACGEHSDVCNRCDRGQIYCPACKPIQKRERIQRARNKYKKSQHGRVKRAASSQNRRDKIKAEAECQNSPELPYSKKIEGDQGPLSPQVPNTTPEPAILAKQKNQGASDNVQFSNPIFNSSKDKSEGLPRKKPQIICSFCKRECSPFQRQKKGRLGAQEKKNFQRWRARSRGKDP